MRNNTAKKAIPKHNTVTHNLTPFFIAFIANIIEPITEIIDSKKKSKNPEYDPVEEKALPNDKKPNKIDPITEKIDSKT